ncbi:MAG: hypothetical protein K2L95_04365 [Alphaproteobacteria bacterium]|nr:hypothetical protein [Alphaproteobacteria bacterium]
MWCHNATALVDTQACADCYCCTNGTQYNCKGTCYYNTSCCNTIDCPDGYIWDSGQGECVPNPVEKFCINGTYPTDTKCEPCPEPTDFEPTDDKCSVTSPGGTPGSGSGMISATAIETCYMPQKYWSLDGSGTCEYTDASGTFELSQNCNYSAKFSLE